MLLVKEGRVVADPWVRLSDDEPAPAAVPIVVSLSRWRSERASLLARGGSLAVWPQSHERPVEIANDVAQLSLIVVDFPTFRDGRGYSTGRILRERHGYRGELRATGQVLRDQFLFLQRCGFDAVEVADQRAADAWWEAIAEISVFYQTTGDGRVSAADRRRQPAKAAE
jgi:uncharacterized protein (DUF934 family)